jgi:hypothetical protein
MVPTWLLIHPRVACHGPQHPHHKATWAKHSKVAQFLFSTVETFDSKSSSSEWVLDSHCQFDKECQKKKRERRKPHFFHYKKTSNSMDNSSRHMKVEIL